MIVSPNGYSGKAFHGMVPLGKVQLDSSAFSEIVPFVLKTVSQCYLSGNPKRKKPYDFRNKPSLDI